MRERPTFTLQQLARTASARLHGDGDLRIHGLGSLAAAGPDEISHLSSPSYRPQLATSRAAAVILAQQDLPRCS
jgi:UDP-3-O-[3-hydroxymyristoyl] glucosamine N-acyltransferase